MKFNQSHQYVCPDSGCSKLFSSLNLLSMSTSHAFNFLNFSIEPVENFGLKLANGRCFPLGHLFFKLLLTSGKRLVGNMLSVNRHSQGRWCEKFDSNFH